MTVGSNIDGARRPPRSAQHVLDHLWDSSPATAAELMDSTGLTRARVLTLCRDLADQGWLEQVAPVAPPMGRPALRYRLRPRASLVVGVDAGHYRISASVAGLDGIELGTAERPFQGNWDAVENVAHLRRSWIRDVVEDALQRAGASPGDIGCVILGVPAPVDERGDSPRGINAFWSVMNPELTTLFADRPWQVLVENDANLAAIAEERSSLSETESYAALLSGERFGAGLVLRGELLRQPRGGAGELGFLDLVSGVESTDGLGSWARKQATDRLGAMQGESLGAVEVFEAADRGDSVAQEIVEELADRLARISAVLAGVLDLDRIVICGAVAPAVGEVIALAREKLADYLYAPWLRIEASQLGADVVRRGAVQFALDHVRRHALEITLTSAGAEVQPGP